MSRARLLLASLKYNWRSNLAVVAGVATAVAVLAGALVVGESMRHTLRRMALDRIGRTEAVIQSGVLFREQLGQAFSAASPMIQLEGLLTHQSGGRRAAGVAIYGVDDRFWKFHGRAAVPLASRDSALSAALAAELEAKPGDTLVLRIEKPTDIPAESLFGRKDSAAPTIRLNMTQVLGASSLGEFSLRPTQAASRAVFVPLGRIQREMNVPGRVNVLLLGRMPSREALAHAFTLEDLGIRTRVFAGPRAIQVDTAAGIIGESLEQAALRSAQAAGLNALPLFTYMATRMRIAEREIPYSLVAATDLTVFGAGGKDPGMILFHPWAVQQLQSRPGDRVRMDYLLWHSDGRLTEQSAEFSNGSPVPPSGLATDRDLTPDYPGITDASNVSDWDPPFPMDLSRIRPADEDYWDRYRTTPKAWISIERGRELWQSRWGKLTALRLTPTDDAEEALERGHRDFRRRLRAAISPEREGLVTIPVREQNLAAARGATDFGEYFTYFSFFLMMSALLLAGLFFRLGIEQRLGEVGLLRAVGFSPAQVGGVFLLEGAVLAVAGSLLGAAGSVAYARLILYGLGTWWHDAVGIRQLDLHVPVWALAAGSLGGVAAGLAAVLITLRGIRKVTPRRLLAGGESAFLPSWATRASRYALGFSVAGVALLVLGTTGAILPVAGFFGAGTLLLAAALAVLRSLLSGSLRQRIRADGTLAFRTAASRPGRTILSAALIASATFLLVSVETFRRDSHQVVSDPKSGTGGYPLMAESVRPLYHDPNTPAGRDALGLSGLDGVRLESFRLRPGDDSSCLNLYEPQNPRILGAPPAFRRTGRFTFSAREDESEDNPWQLLDRDRPDDAIPAIADANSLQYVLHKRIGEEVALPGGARLRIVAALSDSVFQSELVIGERHFQRLFPREQGYRVFLIDVPEPRIQAVSSALENALSDHGFDVTATADRLAAFHRVENAYLSTFQTLGGLGLLLGTIGLAAVLMRNVLERRGELALLTAVGYSRRRLAKLVLLENLLVLMAGLAIGVASAVLAIAPALALRGPRFSLLSMVGLLAAVALTGVVTGLLATRLALRGSLGSALRAG
jgi:ABC-type lipoprotein release transport system permease subunit